MRPLAFICLLGCNLGLLGSVFAYEPLLPLSKPVVQPSFAPVVKKVAPAVVNVMTTRSLSGAAFAPLMADPFFKQYFDYQKELNTAPEAPASLGSGVIVRADGIVITNYHVIQVGSEINVILADGRTFGASIVSVDSKTDLAAIKIDAPKGTVFPFLSLYDADALEVGDTVLAIGNPFGVGQSVTSGIVSALSRTQAGGSDFRAFIQTDAAINPGNSGGALVTGQGELVGINTAILSKSGGSVGIGFAIPSSLIRPLISSIDQGGKVAYPWAGFYAETLSEKDLEHPDTGSARPTIVTSIYPGGPADKAGLKVGDVITGINDRLVADEQMLLFRFAALPVGDKAILSVRRAEKPVSVTIVLEQQPPLKTTKPFTVSGDNPLSGSRLAPVTSEMRKKMDSEQVPDGIMVLDLDDASAARRLRLKEGDVIQSINGVMLQSFEDLSGAMEKAKDESEWKIIVVREDQTVLLKVSLRK